ncbi:MAG: sulfatase [Planctomycetota bacterium]|nr:sulfatase [Planctomycetota bacterium]
MNRLAHEGRAALLASLLLGGCGGDGGREAPPNVVLISLDTLRADHLSCYGYGRETSPNIDALAASGVLFEDTVSTTSWTLPAHMSMLTGLAVSAHGICDERLWQITGQPGGPDELPLRGTFLSEVLQRAGYATGGFVTWKYLEERFGFGPGFDVYERLGLTIWDVPEWEARFEDLRTRGRAGDQDAVAEYERWKAEEPHVFDQGLPTADLAVTRALEWVDGRAEASEPFFLFLHLFDIHDPYVPPKEFDRFDPNYEGTIDGKRISTADSPVHAEMDPRDLERVVSLYDGEIAWVDSQIGRVLDRLEALGLREDTVVVLTSDHGEEFFEHGGKTHRGQLHRESVHVPLVISWPGGLPAGRRVVGTTGIVDILPTVCGLVEAQAPACLSGRDLSAVARGEEANAPPDYTTHLVVFPPGDEPPHLHVGLYHDDRHVLLVQRPGRQPAVEVFDHSKNAREEGPGRVVVPGSPEAEELLRWRDEAIAGLGSVRSCSAVRVTDVMRLTPEELALLEATGYGGGDANPVGAHDRLCIEGCFWVR